MNLPESTRMKVQVAEAHSEVATRSEQAVEACLLAGDCEDKGQYDLARAALKDYWQRIGERPQLDGLSQRAQAELLLRVGTIASRIGSAQQIEGAQEVAKDLISESARMFDAAGLSDRCFDANIDLAICYWRLGNFAEARTILEHVRDNVATESELRVRALVNAALIERAAQCYRDALKILLEAAPLFKDSTNHLLRGSFHNSYGAVLKNLGEIEGRSDYIDRSFIEYAAASFHFEQAGHLSHMARIENNLGLLFLTVGKTTEAHRHLNRARALFVKQKDKGSIGQVDETRARAFLAEARNTQAEASARTAITFLRQGGEAASLSEALTTHGVALARLGRYQRSLAAFKSAIEIAEQADDNERAGTAVLGIVEELSEHLRSTQLLEYYKVAESRLGNSQSAGMKARLGIEARKILNLVEQDNARQEPPTVTAINASDGPNSAAEPAGEPATWSGCSLEAEVLRYEGELIKRALETAGGSVTRAARLLGVTHQGLAFILNGRQRSLLTVRTPARSRRRSIFKKRSVKKASA